MPLKFPSFEFLQALQKMSGEKPAALAPHVSGDRLVGLDMDGHTFMVDFEDGAAVAVALGGNPNDLDFSLVAPKHAWLALFAEITKERDAAAPHPLEAMTRSDGPIRLETLQVDGAERFESYREALEAFFDASRDLQIV